MLLLADCDDISLQFKVLAISSQNSVKIFDVHTQQCCFSKCVCCAVSQEILALSQVLVDTRMSWKAFHGMEMESSSPLCARQVMPFVKLSCNKYYRVEVRRNFKYSIREHMRNVFRYDLCKIIWYCDDRDCVLLQAIRCHNGQKHSKALFLSESGNLVTAGFNKVLKVYH